MKLTLHKDGATCHMRADRIIIVPNREPSLLAEWLAYTILATCAIVAGWCMLLIGGA